MIGIRRLQKRGSRVCQPRLLNEDGDWEVWTPGQNAPRETRRATAANANRQIDGMDAVDGSGVFERKDRDLTHELSKVEPSHGSNGKVN